MQAKADAHDTPVRVAPAKPPAGFALVSTDHELPALCSTSVTPWPPGLSAPPTATQEVSDTQSRPANCPSRTGPSGGAAMCHTGCAQVLRWTGLLARPGSFSFPTTVAPSPEAELESWAGGCSLRTIDGVAQAKGVAGAAESFAWLRSTGTLPYAWVTRVAAATSAVTKPVRNAEVWRATTFERVAGLDRPAPCDGLRRSGRPAAYDGLRRLQLRKNVPIPSPTSPVGQG